MNGCARNIIQGPGIKWWRRQCNTAAVPQTETAFCGLYLLQICIIRVQSLCWGCNWVGVALMQHDPIGSAKNALVGAPSRQPRTAASTYRPFHARMINSSRTDLCLSPQQLDALL